MNIHDACMCALIFIMYFIDMILHAYDLFTYFILQTKTSCEMPGFLDSLSYCILKSISVVWTYVSTHELEGLINKA